MPHMSLMQLGLPCLVGSHAVHASHAARASHAVQDVMLLRSAMPFKQALPLRPLCCSGLRAVQSLHAAHASMLTGWFFQTGFP